MGRCDDVAVERREWPLVCDRSAVVVDDEWGDGRFDRLGLDDDASSLRALRSLPFKSFAGESFLPLETPIMVDPPSLRYRDGDRVAQCTAPTTIMGPIVALDADSVTISRGRNTTTVVLLEDLVDVLGGRDVMLHLLIDAAQHGNVVKIMLSKDGLTFDSAAQLARLSTQISNAS